MLEGFGFSSGDHVVVFGPNGAGKSSLLRRLVGYGDADPILDAAYLPQRPYPFRGTADDNLRLGLTDEEYGKAIELARSFGVDGVLSSPAAVLSGGELHRLNLARTLARSEDWVLLDEPLAALDVRDRTSMAVKISGAIGDRGSIIVTHDKETAPLLGDRMVVVIDGEIAQQGELREVFALPVSEAVAGVVGMSNILEGKVRLTQGPMASVLAGDLEVWVPTDLPVGSSVQLLIPAESVTVFSGSSAPLGSARNRWEGTVTELRPAASLVEVVVDVGSTTVVTLVTQGSVDGLRLAPGSAVTLSVKASAVRAVAT